MQVANGKLFRKYQQHEFTEELLLCFEKTWHSFSHLDAVGLPSVGGD